METTHERVTAPCIVLTDCVGLPVHAVTAPGAAAALAAVIVRLPAVSQEAALITFANPVTARLSMAPHVAGLGGDTKDAVCSG